MSNQRYSFFNEYNLLGEFFANQSSNSGRFAGYLKYSPYNSLELHYCISDDGVELKCDRLYGILENGQKCTIIGPFNFNSGAQHYGKVLVRNGIHSCSYVIFGEFFDNDQLMEYCNFTFSGMQEFIHPRGFISSIAYDEKPMLSVKSKDWLLEVNHKASFSSEGSNLINLVNFHKPEQLQRFKAIFEKNFDGKDMDGLSLRKSLEFFFRYTPSSNSTPNALLNNTFSITSIFSILLDRPVFPDEISFKSPSDSMVTYPVLYSLCIERRTLELAQENFSHFSLPFTWNKIDMTKLLERWFGLSSEYLTLSTAYQYETGMRTINYAFADIILYATQLEAINNELGKYKGDKYEAPIMKYSSPQLVGFIRSIFSRVNDDGMGINISNLRNELAHVGKPKKLMKNLNINHYINIGLALKLVVTSHLLNKLGLNEDNIFAYQKRLIPKTS